MYVITSRAHPSEDHERFGELSGALVTCFVDFRDPWGAEQLASAYARADGWVPEETLEVLAYDPATGADAPEWEAHLEQARRRGVSLLYRPLPLDPLGEGPDYDLEDDPNAE